MNPITVGELIELAKLGKQYIEMCHKRNVIAWLGIVPSNTDLMLIQAKLGGSACILAENHHATVQTTNPNVVFSQGHAEEWAKVC